MLSSLSYHQHTHIEKQLVAASNQPSIHFVKIYPHNSKKRFGFCQQFITLEKISFSKTNKKKIQPSLSSQAYCFQIMAHIFPTCIFIKNTISNSAIRIKEWHMVWHCAVVLLLICLLCNSKTGGDDDGMYTSILLFSKRWHIDFHFISVIEQSA